MNWTSYLWTFLLIGFSLSLAAEYRIHVSNVRYLIHHGATIRGSKRLEWFYRFQVLLIVGAFVEHVGFKIEDRSSSILGLIILGFGFVLRHWGILRLGRLWTRQLVLFRRRLVTRDVKGPEWIHRPDIIGRVIEVAGLSLVLQSMVVLYLTVSILPIWAYTIVKQEIQLSKNELIDY